MTVQEAIELLSEIRCGYNCFIEEERPFYKALSVAIEVLSAQEKPYLWQKEMVKILSAQLDNNSTEVDNRNDELSCSEEPNRSDVISRQDAIYCVKQATIGETDVMKALVKAQTHLMRLPSAQTDLSGYSDRLWKTAYDRGYERCRQDAIDALQKEIDEGIPPFNDAGIRCGVRFASSIIEDLPSAQPEKSTTAEKSQLREENSTRKMIYLDDAIDALVEKGQASRRYKLGQTWELNLSEIHEALDSIPSVQPEQNGEWVCFGMNKLCCLDCGEIEFERKNYCANCGRKMSKEVRHFKCMDCGKIFNELMDICPNCGADIRKGESNG